MSLIKAEIKSADVMGVLDFAIKQGVELYDAERIGPYMVNVSVSASNLKLLKKCSKRYGADFIVIKGADVDRKYRALMNRPILILMYAFVMFLTFWVPGRVFFFSVEGNGHISEQEILQCAESYGVSFGAKRDAVRSEKVKNGILESIDGLEWAGVNTLGCVAVISVRESVLENERSSKMAATNVIADRDGMILSVTATEGETLVAVGQVVKKDQILISGRTASDLFVKYGHAEGEVYAQTNRQISIVSPLKYDSNTCNHKSHTAFSLIVGKNRVNLSKGSGIYCTGCDKISKEYRLILPGGFVLPISLSAEHYTPRVAPFESFGDTPCVEQILSYSDRYLLEQIISGRIASRRYVVYNEQDTFCATLVYVCAEMIGRQQEIKPEVIYGKSN